MTDRLENLTQALQVLASTQKADSARAIAERCEAVRGAGAAFEAALMTKCISYTSVFADPDRDGEWDDEDADGSFRVSLDDDEDAEWDGEGLPEGARLSVRIREDFVLVDEQALRESALRVFEQRGPWPPQVDPEAPVTHYLAELVHEIGLHEITFGDSVLGLEHAGGQAQVLVVDSALQEGEDW